jgi:lauroyl/myristoyl acyltransferase
MAGEGILAFLQVLRSHRFDRWVPAVRLAGFDRIERALQAGRGVVLWVAHAFHGHLAAKVAFRKAGLSVSHLSRPTHGFSSSRFGIGYLNRIQTAVEDRYLAERILLPLEGQNAALNLLVRRLRANGVVSITAQRGTGRTVDAPFLGGSLALAPGAPALADMTGATLLPVFAFRDESGVVEVTVEPPIEIRSGAPREAAVAHAVRSYAAVLEPYVLRHPGQWLGWVQL